MIGIPRALVAALTGLFSAYLVVTAVISLFQGVVVSPLRVVVAILLYGVATAAVLFPGRKLIVPLWSASVAFGVALAVMILVSSAIDPSSPLVAGHATWYVAGIGTLMTGVVIRRRPLFAWAGVVALAVHTAVWAGPAALVDFGVTGAAAAVGAAHILTAALAQADRESERYSLAERQAAEWQAAEEARLNERQLRIAATSRAALPMLRRIADSVGDLDEGERAESLRLEAGIRDEIRGRRLLDDQVRAEVSRARRRGVEVALLDEGGIDELDPAELPRVHAEIAQAIRSAEADKIVVRTVAEGSPIAVTVVGLRAGSEAARLLGRDEDEEMVLWLEVPRVAPATRH